MILIYHSKGNFIPLFIPDNAFANLYIDLCIFMCKDRVFCLFGHSNPWLCLKLHATYLHRSFNYENFGYLFVWLTDEGGVLAYFVEKDRFERRFVQYKLSYSLRDLFEVQNVGIKPQVLALILRHLA